MEMYRCDFEQIFDEGNDCNECKEMRGEYLMIGNNKSASLQSSSSSSSLSSSSSFTSLPLFPPIAEPISKHDDGGDDDDDDDDEHDDIGDNELVNNFETMNVNHQL
jgi:hypothetical protein